MSWRNFKHGKCSQCTAKYKGQIAIENLKNNNKNVTYYPITQNMKNNDNKNVTYYPMREGGVTCAECIHVGFMCEELHFFHCFLNQV